MKKFGAQSAGRWLRRTTFVAASVATILATVPQVSNAQTAEGSVFGHAPVGAVVTVRGTDTGITRTVTTGSDGSFTVSRLPPGRYNVSGGGKSVDVTVVIGSGVAAELEQELAEAVVAGSSDRGIDFSSTESNSVYSQEMIQELPIPLNVNAVAALTPTVLRGDAGLGDGDLPSFAGSSVAENAYYINGFDVTNIRNFLSYADLPFEAISQQQVKSGGYGAEFGRSLGGVISLVTKRGTNEWKGGASFIYEPDSMRASGQNVLNYDAPGRYSVFDKADERENFTSNFYLGGPIIKDKLFVFGLLQIAAKEEVDYFINSSTIEKSDTPSGMLKLDWNIADGHSLELTGIYNKHRVDYVDYRDDSIFYATTHVGSRGDSYAKFGGSVAIAKYTGAITDNFTVSALYGRVEDLVGNYQGGVRATDGCPVVLDVDTSEIGCWSFPFPGGSGGRLPEPWDKDKREAGRLDFEYILLNDHKLRAGIDYQKFTSSEAGGSTYTGGHYYRYFVVPANGVINGVSGFTPGTQYVRDRIVASTSGAYEVINSAFYLEDNWQVTDSLLLYGGLRSESFDNRDGAGTSFVKKDNLLAPRLGFSLRLPMEQPTKLYGTAGRYFIPVAANTNIRSTRSELFSHRFYQFASRDPVTQAPVNLGPEIGVGQIISNGLPPDPSTIADTELKPLNQDEFILGIERELSIGWTTGLKAIYRKLNDGMDDYCSHLGFEEWAADQGYDDFDSSLMASCALINPGSDVHLNIDIDGSGNYIPQVVPASYIGLGKYTRTYKGLEFTFQRPSDGKWSLNGSYVLSASKGTGEGYVQSTIDQDDAGVTQDFDFPSLDDGANGYLPNDRRHALKLFGTYSPFANNFQIGANVTVISGRPLSCIGFVPPSAPDYTDAVNYSTASSYYCLNDAGVAELHQRGTAGRTPWVKTLDLQARYTFKDVGSMGGKLVLQGDIFNVFNMQDVTERNEQRDFSRQTSNAASGNTISQNYLSPRAFMAPRSVRLAVRFEF
jgi:hypothetical protein